jgi:hypothetical protein
VYPARALPSSAALAEQRHTLHPLLRAALEQLQVQKPQYWRALDGGNIDHLAQMPWQYALLAMLQMLRSTTTNIRAPAKHLVSCCYKIQGAIDLLPDTPHDLWEQMAAGDSGAGVPAFVQVWKADASVKAWLEVSCLFVLSELTELS